MSIWSELEDKTEQALRITLGFYQPLSDLTTNIIGSFPSAAVTLPIEVICRAEACEEAIRHSGIYRLHAEVTVRVQIDDTLPATAKAIFGACRDCCQQTDFVSQLSDSVTGFHVYDASLDQPSDFLVENRIWERSLTLSIVANPSDAGQGDPSSSSSSSLASSGSSGTSSLSTSSRSGSSASNSSSLSSSSSSSSTPSSLSSPSSSSSSTPSSSGSSSSSPSSSTSRSSESSSRSSDSRNEFLVAGFGTAAINGTYVFDSYGENVPNGFDYAAWTNGSFYLVNSISTNSWLFVGDPNTYDSDSYYSTINGPGSGWILEGLGDLPVGTVTS